MKNQLATLLMLATLNCQLLLVRAQGVLTPPGAPAPMMKSLDQIEARTAITNTSSLVTISQPGSYYLTHNLTVSSGDAIDITTNDVTLDLNGFTIFSTAASAAGTAINLNNPATNSDITIFNGHIKSGVTTNVDGVYTGSGFANGISYAGGAPANVRVSGISVMGVLTHGINLWLGASTSAEACTVWTAGGYGVVATTIRACLAIACGNTAIWGYQVTDSQGQSASGFAGVSAEEAKNCYGSNGTSFGINSFIAQNCYGTSVNGQGINAVTALNSYGSGGSPGGLYCTTAQNCQGLSGSGIGLSATTAQNCYGSSYSSYGLNANTAQNCYGTSTTSIGLYANMAQNCYGSGGTYGINAPFVATSCYGYGTTNAGVLAFIANSCHGGTSTGTALNTTHNVNSY